MITITVDDLARNTAKYLGEVERGESIEVRKDDKLVAIVSPAAQRPENGNIDLPHLSLDQYRTMSSAERDRLQIEAYERNWEWIERKLGELQADWMVVVGGKVRLWSRDPQEYPTDEQLWRLAEEANEAPFVFIRSPLVEESAWTMLAEGDAYPSLELHVGGHRLLADFDTGSPRTILDDDWLVNHGLVSPLTISPVHVRKHLGSPYRCRSLPVALEVVDENGASAQRTVFCLSVLDWRRSPWCSALINPRREALAGRDLFRAFALIAELDGRAQTTRVRLPGEPAET
jgi:antitoxin (DNA-binding transcriptional repressor) of toxin-antitoxin stability system